MNPSQHEAIETTVTLMLARDMTGSELVSVFKKAVKSLGLNYIEHVISQTRVAGDGSFTNVEAHAKSGSKILALRNSSSPYIAPLNGNTTYKTVNLKYFNYGCFVSHGQITQTQFDTIANTLLDASLAGAIS
ncbi:MAG: hypothetical protein JRN21_09310 [Nitrososphaerota archaeon]|nr:hypothetical protein [Nitrososphaerota archaeon]